MFSVVIPTLQRSDQLHPLVEQCANHELVHEVLIINNSQVPLVAQSPRVRVLQQEENIFVNPAWNLGAAQATSEYLAIINDDVRFDDDVFRYCAKLLRSQRWGMIGPDKTCFRFEPTGSIDHRPATFTNLHYGYGTFMALRREDYVPIPEQLKIWGGDDWLFAVQHKQPAALISTRFVTDDGVTTSSPEFQALREHEVALAAKFMSALHGSRPWHRMARVLQWARDVRHKVKNR